jgi:hypothetical protein
MILKGSFEDSFSQISIRRGIYIRRHDRDSTPGAADFSKIANYLYIFHQICSPETSCPLKEFFSQKIPLIAVGKLKERGPEIGPFGNKVKGPARGQKAQPETTGGRRLISASPADEVSKFRRGNSIVMQKEQDISPGKHGPDVLLYSPPFNRFYDRQHGRDAPKRRFFASPSLYDHYFVSRPDCIFEVVQQRRQLFRFAQSGDYYGDGLAEKRVAIQPLQVGLAIHIISLWGRVNAESFGFELPGGPIENLICAPRAETKGRVDRTVGPDKIETAVGGRAENGDLFSRISECFLYVTRFDIGKVAPDENRPAGALCECRPQTFRHSLTEVIAFLRAKFPWPPEFIHQFFKRVLRRIEKGYSDLRRFPLHITRYAKRPAEQLFINFDCLFCTHFRRKAAFHFAGGRVSQKDQERLIVPATPPSVFIARKAHCSGELQLAAGAGRTRG